MSDDEKADGGQGAAQELADKALGDDASEDSPGVEPDTSESDPDH